MRYETRGNLKFYYFYDAYGTISAIRYYPNSTSGYMYYPLVNSQGDVIALYDSKGTCVVTYEYDAWGNCTIVSDTSGRNIGELNPIRYRGYYYDTETGLYYLQSRYYNPQVGRFLNADGYVTTGQGVTSYNMFTYCMNNPVMYSDPSGKWGFLAALGFCLFIASAIDTIISIQNATKPLPQQTIALNNTMNKLAGAAEFASDMLNVEEELNEMNRTRIEHVRNVVNAGSAKERGEIYSVYSPNKNVFSNANNYQQLCEDTYSIMISKTVLEIGKDINGVSWDGLTLEEQTKLVNTIGAWDNATALNIGFNCSRGVLKEVLL